MEYLADQLGEQSNTVVKILGADEAWAREPSIVPEHPDHNPLTGVLRGLVRDAVSRNGYHIAALDLPWGHFSPADIHCLLAEFPEKTSLVLVDGPYVRLERSAHRVSPSISPPNHPEFTGELLWGARFVMARRRPARWRWNGGGKWICLTGTTRADFYLNQLEKLKPAALLERSFEWGSGPYAAPELVRRASASGINCIRPESFRNTQLSASYALCRFGVGALEMMALGTPTIILPGWRPEEESEIEAIRSHKLAIVLDDWNELGRAMKCLQQDIAAARSLSKTCIRHFSAFAVSTLLDL